MNKEVSNAASALGEAVGKMFEGAVLESLKKEVIAYNCTVQPDRLKNGTDNVYQIDAVIYDGDKRPIVIIDPKYIRYKKHNRDKASWLCVAHYNLRKTYPSIRKSIAVLAGSWSQPSKALIRSFGVEIFEVPFDKMVAILGQYGIDFDWGEKDRETPKKSWSAFCALDEEARTCMANTLVQDIADDLRNAVNQVLGADMNTLPARISGVEVLVKTDRDEMILLTFDTVADSIGTLSKLVSDRTNIADVLPPTYKSE